MREREPGESALAAFRRFLMSRGGVLQMEDAGGDREATRQLRMVTRVITDSPALLARERQVIGAQRGGPGGAPRRGDGRGAGGRRAARRRQRAARRPPIADRLRARAHPRRRYGAARWPTEIRAPGPRPPFERLEAGLGDYGSGQNASAFACGSSAATDVVPVEDELAEVVRPSERRAAQTLRGRPTRRAQGARRRRKRLFPIERTPGPPADGDLLRVDRVAHDEVVRRRARRACRRRGSHRGSLSPDHAFDRRHAAAVRGAPARRAQARRSVARPRSRWRPGWRRTWRARRPRRAASSTAPPEG